MNATETKQITGWYREDIDRLNKAVEKANAECTHVYADGTTAVRYHEVLYIPGSLQTGQACQACFKWVREVLP